MSNSEHLPGFHFLYCDLCQKETIWYLGRSNTDKIHCNNHTAWTGQKHVIVEKASNHVQVTAVFAPVHEAPKEWELRRMNLMDRSLWRSAEERTAHKMVDGPERSALLESDTPTPAPVQTLDLNILRCHFCGVEVSSIAVLQEKKPKIKIKMESFRTGDGEVEVREKAVVQVETINACPKCSLQIRKPIVVRTV